MIGRRRPGWLLAALALSALGACGAPSVSQGNTQFGYTRGEILLATAERPLRVETFGRVDPRETVDQATLDYVVAEAMTRHGPRWFGGSYTAEPEGEPEPRYRLRWLFNLPLGFKSHDVCGAKPGEESAGWTEPTGQVLAAFCRRERSLSYTYGSLGQGLEMNTPEFSRFIGTMGLVLLPPVRENRDRRCRTFRLCR